MEATRFSASAVARSLVCQMDAMDARSPVRRPAASTFSGQASRNGKAGNSNSGGGGGGGGGGGWGYIIALIAAGCGFRRFLFLPSAAASRAACAWHACRMPLRLTGGGHRMPGVRRLLIQAPKHADLASATLPVIDIGSARSSARHHNMYLLRRKLP
jgi:hypothetical protein